jgi:hypothetical protein
MVLLLGGTVRAQLPPLANPWELIAHRADGQALGVLATAIRDPKTLRDVNPITLHAVVGFDPERRDRVERILVTQLRAADTVPGHKLHVASLLAELGGLSPGGLEVTVRYLGAEVGRPSLSRKRTDSARILKRLLSSLSPADAQTLCAPLVASLIDQVRQTEESALLEDQTQGLLALAGQVSPEQWRFVAGRLRRAMARADRAIAVLADVFVRVVAEMDVATAEVAVREVVPVLLAALPRAADAEVLPLAGWLATLAMRLPDEDVARLGAAACPRVTASFEDSVRLAALLNDTASLTQLRPQLPRLVTRWAPEDAARVAAAFDPRQVANIPRVVIPPPEVIPVTRAEGEQLRASFLALVRMKRVEENFVIGRARGFPILSAVINPVFDTWPHHGIEVHVRDVVHGLGNVARFLDPEDAVAILMPVLRDCAMTRDEAELTIPLTDALLMCLERLGPERCRHHFQEATPFLARFVESAPEMFSGLPPTLRYRPYDEFLARIGVVLKRSGAGELTGFRVRLARCVLAYSGTVAQVWPFLDPTPPERQASAITASVGSFLASPTTGWSIPAVLTTATQPPADQLPAQVCVEFLKRPTCAGPVRRAILDVLEARYGESFPDQWAFVRFATERRLGLDLSSPPQP